MAPLLWPKDLQLKLRVGACFTAIAGARAANLLVPQLYRILIDALAGSGDVEPSFPLGIVILYAVRPPRPSDPPPKAPHP